MTLNTTLEPCMMCMDAILLHHAGRVLYGSRDTCGGAGQLAGHMPVYFEEEMSKTTWIGPAYSEGCDPLYEGVMMAVENRWRFEDWIDL